MGAKPTNSGGVDGAIRPTRTECSQGLRNLSATTLFEVSLCFVYIQRGFIGIVGPCRSLGRLSAASTFFFENAPKRFYRIALFTQFLIFHADILLYLLKRLGIISNSNITPLIQGFLDF